MGKTEKPLPNGQPQGEHGESPVHTSLDCPSTGQLPNSDIPCGPSLSPSLPPPLPLPSSPPSSQLPSTISVEITEITVIITGLHFLLRAALAFSVHLVSCWAWSSAHLLPPGISVLDTRPLNSLSLLQFIKCQTLEQATVKPKKTVWGSALGPGLCILDCHNKKKGWGSWK